MVREEGVEPSRRKTLEPKSSASTSSATLAYVTCQPSLHRQGGALCHVNFPNQHFITPILQASHKAYISTTLMIKVYSVS